MTVTGSLLPPGAAVRGPWLRGQWQQPAEPITQSVWPHLHTAGPGGRSREARPVGSVAAGRGPSGAGRGRGARTAAGAVRHAPDAGPVRHGFLRGALHVQLLSRVTTMGQGERQSHHRGPALYLRGETQVTENTLYCTPSSPRFLLAPPRLRAFPFSWLSFVPATLESCWAKQVG